jgi:GR25 family glycosyltransferase involved in LPS biosynthesis
MKFYYINLERRPDRKTHMEGQFNNAGIENYERFEALDGTKLQSYTVSVEEICLFKNADFKRKPNTKLLIGNQLSHLRVLQKFLYSDSNIGVVMQDDMVFCKKFGDELENVINNLPEDAEVVNVGFHKLAVYANFIPFDLSKINTEHIKTKVNDYVCKIKDDFNPCSSAYIVTKKGAKDFVEYVYKNGCYRATDCVFNDYLKKKDIFYGSVNVLCTGANMGSDIFV